MTDKFMVKFSATILAVMTAILLFRPVTAAAGISADARACGGTPANVEAEFDLAAGKDIWKVFPAMLLAPELETSTGPIHVVVIHGEFDLSGLAIGNGRDAAPNVTGVVCVVPSGGYPTLYTDVSRAGTEWK